MAANIVAVSVGVAANIVAVSGGLEPNIVAVSGGLEAISSFWQSRSLVVPDEETLTRKFSIFVNSH